MPLVDRLVDQRHHQAALAVDALRRADPDASPDQLADRLIRQYIRDLALGGAVTGGAAAAPLAGVAVAAATTGADITYSMGKLSEMIMAIGIAYGEDSPNPAERSAGIWAVLGIADGATAGMTGLAARVGSRGGARLLARLPQPTKSAVSSKLSRRVMSKVASGRGPWSLASLVPYGIGAGVGAAGNALLARSVGLAAKQFFSGTLAIGSAEASSLGPAAYGDIIEAEVVDIRIGDDPASNDPPVDGELVDDDDPDPV